MKCFKCDLDITTIQDGLKCFQCARGFHLHCLNNVTKDDFDFIVSSNANWKCANCDSVKFPKNDDTPLTPKGGKVFEFKQSESENDSESSTSTINAQIKKLCVTCKKGFAHNAFKMTCLECKNVFHLKCASPIVTKDDYAKVKRTWLCATCKARQGAGIGLPDSEATALLATKRQDGSITLSDILSEMIEFRKEVKKTNKDFTDSLQKYSEWIEESGKQINEASVRLNEAVSKIDFLYQENINLKKSVKDLRSKLCELEQTTKENVLEIHGVPVVKNENVLEVVQKVADAIGFNFNENKIDNCYRFKSPLGSNKPGGILVKFVRKIDVQQFMDKRKQKRNLNTRDLGFMEGEASVVYINSSLTQEKRKLLNEARTARREKNYSFLWVSDGRIMMRKTPGDRAVVISSREDLDRLL